MRILASCIPFDHGRSGISVYMRHTVSALARAGHELTLVVEPEAADEPAFAPFPKLLAPRWVRKPVLSMLWHLFVLPFRIDRRRYDLFFICAANRRAVAFRPVPTAAVVHDLAAHRVRGKYDRFRTFYQTKVLPFFTRRAEYPVAISESTAADMVRFLGLRRERIIMSWNGHDCTCTIAHKYIIRNPDRYLLSVYRIDCRKSVNLNTGLILSKL